MRYLTLSLVAAAVSLQGLTGCSHSGSNPGGVVGIAQKIASVVSQDAKGPRVERTFQYPGVTGVEANSGIIVYCTFADDNLPIRADGPENAMAALDMALDSDGEVKITFKDKNFNFKDDSNRVKVWIPSTRLRDFEANSGSGIVVENPVDIAGEVNIEATSAADVTFAGLTAGVVDAEANSGATVTIAGLSAGKIDAEANSGADIELSGTVETADLDAESGGTINARSLKANYGKAEASSGGTVNSAIANPRIEQSSGGAVSNN